MILIDTSAFIEFLNNSGSIYDKEIEKLIEEDEHIGFTDIGITEILQGIKKEKEFKEVKGIILSFPIYSLKDINSYINASEIYRKCRKKGITIRSTIDILIAQVAIENNLVLLHNDRDFDNIASTTSLKTYVIK